MKKDTEQLNEDNKPLDFMKNIQNTIDKTIEELGLTKEDIEKALDYKREHVVDSSKALVDLKNHAQATMRKYNLTFEDIQKALKEIKQEDSVDNQSGSITYNPENALKYIKMMEKVDLNKVYGISTKK